ncbi:MAG: polyprenyl synthetase family protein [Halobacteriales archaeon]|nr:polyprenyl synthetase family protein [Halobacteriales archaeon]
MEYLETRRALVDDRIDEVLERVEPGELADQVGHVALSGGKRVRPTVTILACEAVGGDPEDAVDFAAGIELVHNASLVIDDIIDESAIRRGHESAWARYGHGPAVIASDGLLGEAFALFSPSPRAMELVSDAMVDLGEGEAAELVAKPTTEAEYMDLARRKTGSLFRAAAELGAVAAGADHRVVNAFGRYAQRVGVAFQIRDDVLDAVADPESLGKPTGQDAAMGRPSMVEVAELSAEEANGRARAQADAALEALDEVTVANPIARDYLVDLANYVVTRER